MKVRAGTVQYDHLLQKKVPLCTDCNQQTCFAAPGASWPCQRPAWGRGEPRGWLKKKAEWKAMSGLIMGSYFFLKTQGVSEASCSHATSTDPRKGKTKQMDWTEARELSTLSQKWSSSAPLLHELPRSIKVTFSSFTSLTWCIFLSRVAISWGSFIFRISRSHPAPLRSFCLLVYIFLLNFISLELGPAPILSVHSSSGEIQHSLTALTGLAPLQEMRFKKRQLWDRGIRSERR